MLTPAQEHRKKEALIPITVRTWLRPAAGAGHGLCGGGAGSLRRPASTTAVDNGAEDNVSAALHLSPTSRLPALFNLVTTPTTVRSGVREDLPAPVSATTTT